MPKKRILIIRPAALGDTLMLLPALKELGQSRSVTLAGREPGIQFAGRFAGLCLDFERMGWHTLFTDEPKVSPLPHADIAAAFLRDEDGKVNRNLRLLFPEGSVHVFPGLPQESESIHAALHLARCLKAAGCSEIDPDHCIEEALHSPLFGGGREDTHQTFSGGQVVFHPGSGGTEKNHQPDSWAELIDTMVKAMFLERLHPILLLGPAEERLIPFFEKRLRGIRHDLVFSPFPESLFSLMRDSMLFVGQDSGVTHLAAMLGVRTIALFRRSSIKMWRPLGPRVTVIEEKQDRVNVSLVLKEADAWLSRRDEQ